MSKSKRETEPRMHADARGNLEGSEGYSAVPQFDPSTVALLEQKPAPVESARRFKQLDMIVPAGPPPVRSGPGAETLPIMIQMRLLETRQQIALRMLFTGLQHQKARMDNGREVKTFEDTIRWLLEQIAESACDSP